MKIHSAQANNHRKAFEVVTARGTYPMPYAKVDPMPGPADPIVRVYVDDELGREGFTYVLRSGAEGSVHVDSVLEHNEDPAFMRDLLLYKLTLEAEKCMKASPLSKREITRRAGTSASQISRLLDVTNTSKSVDKLLVLLSAMDCEVEITVRPKRAALTSKLEA